jgi:flagellar protein FlaI
MGNAQGLEKEQQSIGIENKEGGSEVRVGLDIPDGFDDPSTYKYYDEDGNQQESLVRPEDIPKIIPDSEHGKLDAESGAGYWLEDGYSFALIYRSATDSELKYYIIEPYLTDREKLLLEFLDEKIRKEIDIEEIPLEKSDAEFEKILQRNLFKLLRRFSLVPRGLLKGDTDFYSKTGEVDEEPGPSGIVGKVIQGISKRITTSDGDEDDEEPRDRIDEMAYDMEEMTDEEIEEEARTLAPLSARQVDKIMYYLAKDFVGLKKITPLMNDTNIEDISVDGYHSPVWIYHSEYGDLKTNIHFQRDDLDEIVRYMAEADGKGISKRQPVVDATLPDGSRVQLTLSNEVSEKGSNFTIRLFRDVPFTPIDLINWQTYSIEEMAYLWMCVENNQNIIFAGKTASGKTTSLNAVSLFMPKSKIVTIEDTPELTLPHDHWIESVTREHEREGSARNYEEGELLKTALRQRPEYIIMGEVRDSVAASTLFEAIATGHTTLSTFHGGKPSGVINRFTHDPLNIAPAQFSEMDLLCMQGVIVENGKKKRRAKAIVEVGEFTADEDGGDKSIQRNVAWQYNPKTGDHQKNEEGTQILQQIKTNNGWTNEELFRKFNERKIVLSYLVRHRIQDYSEVAGVLQGYMRNSEAILQLIANDELKEHLDDLKNIDSLNIDVDEEKEEQVIRPVSEEMVAVADKHLNEHVDVLEEAKGYETGAVFSSIIEKEDEPAGNFSTLAEQGMEAAGISGNGSGEEDSTDEDESEASGELSGPLGEKQENGSGTESGAELSDPLGEGQSENGDEITHPLGEEPSETQNGDSAGSTTNGTGAEASDDKQDSGESGDESTVESGPEEDDEENDDSPGFFRRLLGFGSSDSDDADEDAEEDEQSAEDETDLSGGDGDGGAIDDDGGVSQDAEHGEGPIDELQVGSEGVDVEEPEADVESENADTAYEGVQNPFDDADSEDSASIEMGFEEPNEDQDSTMEEAGTESVSEPFVDESDGERTQRDAVDADSEDEDAADEIEPVENEPESAEAFSRSDEEEQTAESTEDTVEESDDETADSGQNPFEQAASESEDVANGQEADEDTESEDAETPDSEEEFPDPYTGDETTGSNEKQPISEMGSEPESEGEVTEVAFESESESAEDEIPDNSQRQQQRSEDSHTGVADEGDAEDSSVERDATDTSAAEQSDSEAESSTGPQQDQEKSSGEEESESQEEEPNPDPFASIDALNKSGRNEQDQDSEEEDVESADNEEQEETRREESSEETPAGQEETDSSNGSDDQEMTSDDTTETADDTATSKREKLLERPEYGETEDDVRLDPKKCFFIEYIKKFDLYRQCQSGCEGAYCSDPIHEGGD